LVDLPGSAAGVDIDVGQVAVEFGVVDFAEFEGADIFAAEVAAEDWGVEKAGEFGDEWWRWAVDVRWYWGSFSLVGFAEW